ncbi:MAG: nucleotide exchange factor GrpE [Pirellulaceae bacterium]|nr:nucleotide exchange factor GrpE [Pirellulaceae bacterium]
MNHPESTDQEQSSGNPDDPSLPNVTDDSNAGVDDFFSNDQLVNSLNAKLKDAQIEVLKSHAEAENFRKRLQRDSEQQLRYANLPLVRDLLDVVDNLKRATDAASGDAANAGALLNGVQMVTNQLTNILTKFACKPIESVGQPFDPNIHEAIAQMPSPDVPAGSVLQEVAVGYVLHDRVIRPSSVIVSTGPA